MARSAAPAGPGIEPQRPEDRRGYYGDAWLRSLAWPAAFLAAVLLGLFSAIYVVRGRQAAAAWLEDITGPAFLSGVGILVVAAVGLVFKVRQIAKAEMHAAAAASNAAGAKAEVTSSGEQTRALVAEVLAAVRAQPPSGVQAHPKTDELVSVVKALTERVLSMEANTAAAADAARGARDATVGYGGVLGEIAHLVTAVTGQVPAQGAQQPQEAPSGPLWVPGGAGVPPSGYSPSAGATEADGPDWSRGGGRRRMATSAQPSVPEAPAPSTPHDEHEDWQEPRRDDDGEGLDTGLVRDFRARMAAAEEEERRTREANARSTPDWREMLRASEAQRRESGRTWTNPEEGN